MSQVQQIPLDASTVARLRATVDTMVAFRRSGDFVPEEVGDPAEAFAALENVPARPGRAGPALFRDRERAVYHLWIHNDLWYEFTCRGEVPEGPPPGRRVVRVGDFGHPSAPPERMAPEQLAHEYVSMTHAIFGLFRGPARRRLRAVAEELLRRGYTHVDNVLGPMEIRP